jgi:hypothetical protein
VTFSVLQENPMSKRLAVGQAYAGRKPGRSVLNFTVDAEAAMLIRMYAKGKLGEFIGRLVHTYHAVQEERERIRTQLALVVKGEET